MSRFISAASCRSVLLFVLLALAASPGARANPPRVDAQQLEPTAVSGPAPVSVLGPEEARDALLDILDSYESVFRQYGIREDLLPEIERARSATLDLTDEDLKQYSEAVGSSLPKLRRMVIEMRVALRNRADEVARGEKGLAEPEHGGLAKSAGFPALRTDVPEYPNETPSGTAGGLSEADVESQEDELEREDEERSGGYGGTAFSYPCLGNPSVPGGRAVRMSNATYFNARVLLGVAEVIHSIADRFCGQEIAGFSCSLCCIPNDIIFIATEVLYDLQMACEDSIDSAELEAAYHNTRTVHAGVAHVHADLGTEANSIRNTVGTAQSVIVAEIGTSQSVIVGEVNTAQSAIVGEVNVNETKIDGLQADIDVVLDNTTCRTVAPLRRGSGCNGNDDNCNSAVDECAEDVFPPVVGFEEGAFTRWFKDAAAATAAVARAVRVTDECGTPAIGAPSLSGTCGAVTATVTVTDACGNATTASTVVKIDAGPPTIVIPAALASTCHPSVDAAEAAVLAATTITDDCTPAARLDRRVDSTVTECNLRVRIEVIDEAGNRSVAATTVRVDTAVPRVGIEPLLLGFRSSPLGFQTPACWRTVAEAEAAVLAATRVSDGCTATESLATTVASSGDPCDLSVTVSATDACGVGNTSSIAVRVDPDPPVVSCAVLTSSLAARNHEMVDVGLSFSATDGCSGTPAVVVRVTSDEPTAEAGGAGGATSSPDAFIQRDVDGTVRRVLLRAECGSSGNGRVYQIHVEATDACGNATRSSCSVEVRHSPRQPAVDDGQFYDATQVN